MWGMVFQTLEKIVTSYRYHPSRRISETSLTYLHHRFLRLPLRSGPPPGSDMSSSSAFSVYSAVACVFLLLSQALASESDHKVRFWIFSVRRSFLVDLAVACLFSWPGSLNKLHFVTFFLFDVIYFDKADYAYNKRKHILRYRTVLSFEEIVVLKCQDL